MSKPVERLVEEQVGHWLDIRQPSAAGEEFAKGLAGVIAGFEKLRGQLEFEDEPSSFEAALQETKERS